MTNITVDTLTREKLVCAHEPVNIVDADGNVLGTFHPGGRTPAQFPEVEPMDIGEMRRHASQPGGRSLGDILDDLEATA